MNWSQIFDEAISGIPDPEYLQEVEKSIAKMRKTWVIFAIREYITQFSLSSADIDLLKAQCLECENFYEAQSKLREYHFGYPGNFLNRSSLYHMFAEYERAGFLANNCGDTFEQGNYKMDSKEIEKSILHIFAQKFGIDTLPYWGYLTSGGSESNGWGIDNGFRNYPNGVLYFCEAAHYSVKKYACKYRYIMIPQNSPTEESINCDSLMEMVRTNPEPAILFLTWGTTRFGSCDDISRIVYELKSLGKEFYLHVDAALYGGIPNNQIDAPVISNIYEMGINSISVSLHKYMGVPFVKSILLATEKPTAQIIDYIGQTDSTTSGSRDILPFSMRQQISDVLKYTDKDEYCKNINIFEYLLKKRSIPYIRSGVGNIFVIDKPSETLCRKYQLSTFEIIIEKEKVIEKAHIIIFPYQLEKIIRELVDDLCREGGISCGEIC